MDTILCMHVWLEPVDPDVTSTCQVLDWIGKSPQSANCHYYIIDSPQSRILGVHGNYIVGFIIIASWHRLAELFFVDCDSGCNYYWYENLTMSSVRYCYGNGNHPKALMWLQAPPKSCPLSGLLCRIWLANITLTIAYVLIITLASVSSYHVLGYILCIYHTSKSGRALRAEKSVIVFPDPGGPQSTIGLCSASQV